MNIEQTLNTNTQETSKVVEVSKPITPIGFPSVEDGQKKDDVKEKKEENDQKIKAVRDDIMKQFETKERYPEGHIFNPKMLDKIAQLGAISTDTYEFIQSRYDHYIGEEQKGRHGKNSVTYNQENLKKLLEEGTNSEEDIYQFDAEVIYGEGGWLRFKLDENGLVKLESGISSTNTTGDKKYFEVLRNKGKELGMDL